MEERKRNEGHEHLQKAEKYLETSYMKLKFSPDWDSAANEFNKAAVCFKVKTIKINSVILVSSFKIWDVLCEIFHCSTGFEKLGSLQSGSP